MDRVDLSKPEYVNNENVTKKDNCSICYDYLGDEVLSMCYKQCKNVFHTDCIKLWMGRSSTCPMCRKELVLKVAVISNGELVDGKISLEEIKKNQK